MFLTICFNFSYLKGDAGSTGPQGPIGPIMEGSTEGMLFASFAETNISSLMNIQETHIIPTDSEFFKINGRNDIIVNAGIIGETASSQVKINDVNLLFKNIYV